MEADAAMTTTPVDESKYHPSYDVSQYEIKSSTAALMSANPASNQPTLPVVPLPVSPPPPPRVLPPLPPAPAVIILRGLSGSGKSSIAKHYQSLALSTAAASSSSSIPPATAPLRSQTIICSADNFFLRNNRYLFDSKLLSQAHSACLSSFLTLLASRSPYAIVDNTHIERWSYDNFIRVAEMMGYGVVVVEVTVSGEDEVRACSERSVHGVAYSGCQSMAARFEEDSRAVRVNAEWTAEDRRRMAQRRRAREQAKLQWQMTQQMREQQTNEPMPQSVQQHQPHQQSTPSYYHQPLHHHHNNHQYQPYPQHRHDDTHRNQPNDSHHHQQSAAGEGYREGRSGDNRGRGRGGWRGGGVAGGGGTGRGGYAIRGPMPINAQTLASSTSTVPPQSAPLHSIRWMPKQSSASAEHTDNSISSSHSATSRYDASPSVNLSLVSAPNQPNKRYVIDDTPA